MRYVNEIKFETGEDKVDEEEVEQMWKVDNVIMSFNCPLCGELQEFKRESPIKHNEKHKCGSCHVRYYIVPKNNTQDSRELKNMNLDERIDMQLQSVKKVRPIFLNQPAVTAEISHAFEITFVGSAAVFPGTMFLPLFYVSVLELTGSNLFATLGLLFFSLAIFGALHTLYDGYLGTTYYNYLVYKRNKGQFSSFFNYVRNVGNYYNIKSIRMLG